ncbi:MAG: Ig domain-containing protein [Acidimicrobiales bacterium]
MITRATQSIAAQKRRYIVVAIAFALVAGLLVSFVVTPDAQADYATACGYGYSSSGTFGYGSGNAFGYGYGYGGTFHFGYGDQVCPLFVTSSSLPAGTVGVAYPSQQLTATGGTDSYTWSLASGALPAGLTLSSAGAITGTPTASGAFSFVVAATDANGQSIPGNLSIAVASATTTTVKSAPKTPHPTRIIGSVRSRKTSNITIVGSGFYGQPRITSNDPGTRVVVRHDSGTQLKAVVQVRGIGHVGRVFTFTIRDADGHVGRIKYVLRK